MPVENDPREIRAAAVDAQRMSDWLLARERDRTPVEDRADASRSDSDEPVPSPPRREADRPEVGLSR